MGRRSSHTAEELRELILDASTALISEGGLASLSAREVARRIGYSPGTLYNVFENLDDVGSGEDPELTQPRPRGA